MYDRYIFDVPADFFFDMTAHFADNALRIPFTAFYISFGHLKGLVKGGNAPPFVFGEIDVARAHRQAVGFAHGRCDFDAQVEVQIADQSANDGGLLVVLLAEDRQVRFGGGK